MPDAPGEQTLKWRNHAIMAGAIVLMMDLGPAEIAYCVIAVNLPDQIEKIGGIRVARHRTWTHELLVWLLPLLCLRPFPNIVFNAPQLLSLPPITLKAAFAIHAWVLPLPCILHLAGDLLTPAGIKVGSRKVSLGLFPTGHPAEYLIAALFVLAAAVYLFR
ncbi:MAG: hypothetical protein AB9866_08775 [Syntrophobacteraceae bacterium]